MRVKALGSKEGRPDVGAAWCETPQEVENPKMCPRSVLLRARGWLADAVFGGSSWWYRCRLVYYCGQEW
jgi:hypothetical protein